MTQHQHSCNWTKETGTLYCGLLTNWKQVCRQVTNQVTAEEGKQWGQIVERWAMTATGKFYETCWCKDRKKSLRVKRQIRETEPVSSCLRMRLHTLQIKKKTSTQSYGYSQTHTGRITLSKSNHQYNNNKTKVGCQAEVCWMLIQPVETRRDITTEKRHLDLE